MVSSIVFSGQILGILDGRQHRWHLRHHQPSIRAVGLTWTLSECKIPESTYLHLKFELLNGCDKITANHFPRVSTNSRIEFDQMVLQCPDVVVVWGRVDVDNANWGVWLTLPCRPAIPNQTNLRPYCPNQLDSDTIQLLDFGVHGVCYAGLLRNGVVLNLRVQVGNESPNGRTFNEAKRLSKNGKNCRDKSLNDTYQVACGNDGQKMLFDPLLRNRLFTINGRLLTIRRNRLLFQRCRTGINRKEPIRQVK